MNHNIFISNWCNWASSRRANSKWYDIIAHSVLRFEFWLKYLFFLFHFVFISSHSRATCSRKKCVHTIHQFFIIEIHINKATFSCFFLLSFLSFEMMLSTRRGLFSCITKLKLLSCIMKHLLIDFMLTMKTLWRFWACAENAL